MGRSVGKTEGEGARGVASTDKRDGSFLVRIPPVDASEFSTETMDFILRETDGGLRARNSTATRPFR